MNWGTRPGLELIRPHGLSVLAMNPAEVPLTRLIRAGPPFVTARSG